jgi:hypothetical protein
MRATPILETFSLDPPSKRWVRAVDELGCRRARHERRQGTQPLAKD